MPPFCRAGPNHLGDQLGPAGHEQQRLAHHVHLPAMFEQQLRRMCADFVPPGSAHCTTSRPWLLSHRPAAGTGSICRRRRCRPAREKTLAHVGYRNRDASTKLTITAVLLDNQRLTRCRRHRHRADDCVARHRDLPRQFVDEASHSSALKGRGLPEPRKTGRPRRTPGSPGGFAAGRIEPGTRLFAKLKKAGTTSLMYCQYGALSVCSHSVPSASKAW